jgi:hypothetical protein
LWKACSFCFNKTEFWTQIMVGPIHEKCGSFCNLTICCNC